MKQVQARGSNVTPVEACKKRVGCQVNETGNTKRVDKWNTALPYRSSRPSAVFQSWSTGHDVHDHKENHKDAWANYGKGALNVMGSGGGNFVLRNAKLVKQPADGSCLFHSLCVGLANRDAEGLRRELARFVAQNPHVEISGDTIEEWVRWDANTSCELYARRMERSGWDGGIEMAVCSLLKKVNVHVYERYERSHGDFLRISCFDDPEARKTVHVLYQGEVHFDALLPGRG